MAIANFNGNDLFLSGALWSVGERTLDVGEIYPFVGERTVDVGDIYPIVGERTVDVGEINRLWANAQKISI